MASLDGISDRQRDWTVTLSYEEWRDTLLALAEAIVACPDDQPAWRQRIEELADKIGEDARAA